MSDDKIVDLPGANRDGAPEPGAVKHLPLITRHDVPVERVIAGAASANLKGVVIMGWTQEGEPFFASSYSDGGDVMWLIELLKKRLLA